MTDTIYQEEKVLKLITPIISFEIKHTHTHV